MVEPERVAIIEMPSGELVAELGLQPEAEGVDVGWLAGGTRLLVVSRLPDHTLLHLLDVAGGGVRLCAEKRVEAAMRLLATSGPHALLAGAVSSAVATCVDDNVAIHPVAARGVPAAAGALGSQLVVALSGAIELWDPVARVAKRRLKLPRPAQLSAIGGSERQIWLTTLGEPRRVEVVPLINRGQPRGHEVPEDLALIAGHPRLDVLACVGASGQVFVLDLDGRIPGQVLSPAVFGGPPMVLALVAGRVPALVGVAAGQAPRLVALDGKPLAEWPVVRSLEPSAAPPTAPAVPAVPARPPSRAEAPRPPAPPVTASSTRSVAASSAEAAAPRATPRAETMPSEPPSIVGSATVLRPARASTRDDSGTPAGGFLDRLAQWRARSEEAASTATAAPARSSSVRAVTPAPLRGRDALVTWGRGVLIGHGSGPPPSLPALELVLERLALPADTAPTLALLYAAHLMGRSALTPVEASALGPAEDPWREATGSGELGRAHVVRLRGSQLRLAGEVKRFLDGRAPKHGELAGDDTGPPPPHEAMVCLWDPARGASPRETAEPLSQALGCAVLAVLASPHTDELLARLALEARLRYAVAALPFPWPTPLAPGPFLYLAPSPDEVAAAGLPYVEL